MFLERMKEIKQQELEILRTRLSSDAEKVLINLPPVRSMKQALTKMKFGVIAEVKPASPSKGVINLQVDPIAQAKLYADGGASGISILTEKQYFRGNPDWIRQVKKNISLPILRKDFLLDPLQVLESRLLGADVILLIASFLEPAQCEELASYAKELGLEVLLELHMVEEVERYAHIPVDIVGVNHRNLRTLEVNMEISKQLASFLPTDKVTIAESGIHTISDCLEMKARGYHGVLIGEMLMRSEHPSRLLKSMISTT